MSRSLAVLAIVASPLLVACCEGETSNDAAGDGGALAPPGPGRADSDASSPDAAPKADAASPDAPPLGAEVQPSGGVTFRVWAPHATRAWVTGSFGAPNVALAAAGGAVFEAHVPQAKAGDTYAFVLETDVGTITRLDPWCRELTPDRKACRVIDPHAFAWQTPPFTRPKRNELVVYEMHVGSFTAQGTFAAARAKLVDLADLGINAVELMPVHAFGGKANSWGYNPHLWLAPKETYGTADELRAFIDEAHRLGIAVWVDIVVNHADGWAQAPLRCFDGFCPNGSAGIYFFADGTNASTPWGPRPDFTEPRVAEMLHGSVRQWLDEYRGDGFRWDSVSNVRARDGAGTVPGGRELLVRANGLTHQRGALSVAEDLKGLDAITQPTTTAGGFGFDAQWDAFGWDVTSVLAQTNDDQRDMNAIANALTRSYAGDRFARLLWTENHDTVGNGGSRLPNKIDAGAPTSLVARKRSLLAATMLLTTPGVPMLFMGQEALATGGFTDPPAPLAAATAAGTRVRAFYKDAIALRRSSPDLMGSDVEIFHRNDPAKVVAYRRGKAVVVVNMKNKAYTRYDVGVAESGPWHVRLATDDTKYGDDFPGAPAGTISTVPATKDGKPFTLPLVLGAYSALVLAP